MSRSVSLFLTGLMFALSIVSDISPTGQAPFAYAAATAPNSWGLLAAGERTAVLGTETGDNATTLNNGTYFYNNPSKSMGFALNSSISQSSADVTNDPRTPGACTVANGGAYRLSWHRSAGNIAGGWRYGCVGNLNSNETAVRAVFQSDSPSYYPSGPQVNVSNATLLKSGWEECYIGGYGTAVAFSTVATACTKTYIILAGGAGSSVPTLSSPTISGDSSTSTTVSLTFSDVSNASSYTAYLYSSASGGSPQKTVANYTSGTAITGLSGGTTYYATLVSIGDNINYATSAESSPRYLVSTATPTYALTYAGNEDQHQSGETTGSAPSSSSAASGSAVTVSGNTGSLARQGFVFDGWNTASNGSGTDYTEGDSLTLSANTTLYAQWRIPEAARLFGLTESSVRKETIVQVVDSDGNSLAGNIRGITTDGSSVFFLPSNQGITAGIVREVGFDGELIADHTVTGAGSQFQGSSIEARDLTYSSGCLFVRDSGATNSKLYCIDTATWEMVEVTVPTQVPPGGTTAVGLLPGNFWLTGNLIDFPDGRIGAVSRANWNSLTVSDYVDNISMTAGTGDGECPTGFYCKILRLFSISGTGSSATLTFSEDIVLADSENGWPSDDHGIATDGTYLYQSHYDEGYKSYALRSGAPSYVVFNGNGSGACGADSGTSGGLCDISGWSKGGLTVDNATYFGRDHVNKRYLMGDFGVNQFIYTTGATDQPAGVGTVNAPSAPRSVTGSPGNQQVSVSWQAPSSNGGGAISSYTVTASPGGATCTTAALSCAVTGLTNGTSYTFAVYATNNGGNSSPASTSAVSPGVVTSGGSSRTPRSQPSPVPIPTVNTPSPRLPLPLPPAPTPQVLSSPAPSPTSDRSVMNSARASIAGVPAPVSIAREGNSGVSVKAGSVLLDVVVRDNSLGEVVENNSLTQQPEVRVRTGGSAAVQGQGLRPGTTVQVWLPGVSDRELARIPVAADGSIKSDVSIGARQDEKPLPIGRQVLQVTGYDEAGNQTVVEMPVNIAQGPPAPELNRAAGELPDMTPGSSLATSAGIPTDVVVTPFNQERVVAFDGGRWAINVAVTDPNGSVDGSQGSPVIQMTQSGTGNVSGTGFQAGTIASVWFFSDPTLMGTVTVAADGSFDSSFLVDARFIPAGEHTLQIQGVGEDGFIKAANLGVLVSAPTEQTPTSVSFGLSMAWWFSAVFVVLGALLVLLIARRRRQHQ
jgi:uncharacterized repeat protein (TIGR02543 family)